MTNINANNMNKEIQDERYQVVEEAIFEAFLMIYKEKELNRITVSDVIKKAGIVRSTFYNHYDNIPALVDAIEDRSITDIFIIMETFHAQNDRELCKSYFLTICDYTKSNPFLASLIGTPRGDSFMVKTMTMFHKYVATVMQQYKLPNRNKEQFSYMIAGSIGSVLGVLHKWIREDFNVPSDYIAEILTETFMAGLFPFLS